MLTSVFHGQLECWPFNQEVAGLNLCQWWAFSSSFFSNFTLKESVLNQVPQRGAFLLNFSFYLSFEVYKWISAVLRGIRRAYIAQKGLKHTLFATD